MVRGDLPPIAATLNNVLKRDTPGGALSPGRFVFLEHQSLTGLTLDVHAHA
jgi:hypothetical protein